GLTCDGGVGVGAAEGGIKIFDRRRAGLGEGDAMDLEACRFEHAFDQTERAAFRRRHRRAADEIAGKRDWIGGRQAHRRGFTWRPTVASMRMPARAVARTRPVRPPDPGPIDWALPSRASNRARRRPKR